MRPSTYVTTRKQGDSDGRNHLKFVRNGHIYLSVTVTWFVGNLSKNADGIPTTVTVISVNRNIVGSLSVYSDEFLTTTTVICFIGMSSKSRRKIPTSHVFSEIRRKWPIHVSQMVRKLCYISETSVFGLRISSYIAGPIRLINLSTCQGFDTDCKDLI